MRFAQDRLLILSDRHVTEDQWIVSATMATGAVHHRLIEEGLRCSANMIVDTAEARFLIILQFFSDLVRPRFIHICPIV